MTPSFDGAVTTPHPFPHFQVPRILAPEDADRVLGWFRAKAPWALRVESFYEQHEFSLQTPPLDPAAADLPPEGPVYAARRPAAGRREG